MDVTSSSLDKLPIYARIGVPEVWRHDGKRLAILSLREEGGYAEIPESAFLAPARIPSEALSRLVEEGLAFGRSTWIHKVREWGRELR